MPDASGAPGRGKHLDQPQGSTKALRLSRHSQRLQPRRVFCPIKKRFSKNNGVTQNPNLAPSLESKPNSSPVFPLNSPYMKYFSSESRFKLPPILATNSSYLLASSGITIAGQLWTNHEERSTSCSKPKSKLIMPTINSLP